VVWEFVRGGEDGFTLRARVPGTAITADGVHVVTLNDPHIRVVGTQLLADALKELES
jgi:hypothetical protein